ncbi:MAG: tetratricopeptide repeat-containing sensor histidine kinase, partial [Cyclobacteriaceae bacterium]|nr:tetratricopeptide repeat-containing sensor histidine kinase [Cyclobacteriaceae bacterium]
KLSGIWMLKDYNKAVLHAREAIRIADESGLTGKQFLTHRRYGLILNLSGDYTSAIEQENLAMQYALKLGDSTNLGLSYSNIGNYYHEMGIYDEAYYYLTRAYRMLQKGKISRLDSIYMNIALHNIGRVFKELGQYQTAEQHLKLSRKISKLLNDEEGEAYFFDEMGDLKLRLHEYDSALHYLMLGRKEGLRMLQKNPSSTVAEVLPKVMAKVALAFLRQKKFDSALIYYDSARVYHQRTANQYGIADAQLGRGMVFIEQQKFNEGEALIRSALQTAEKLNARLLAIKCHEQLARLYEQKKDFEKAIGHYRQHQQMRDSLFSISMQQKLFRDQVRFETEEKDDIIASLTKLEQMRQSEIKKQELIRNILVVVVALTAILLLTVYRSGQRRRRINMLLLQHQEETEKRSQELEQLNQVKDKFFSIISHDLRSPVNALAGILDLMDKGAIKPEEMPAAISELRKRFVHTRNLLNNLLDWTLLQMDKLNLQASTINLSEIANENIELMNSMHEKKIRLINDIPAKALAYADRNTINLVIRNLLTNAIKFTNEGGEIRISATESPTEWTVSVQDNGIGMNEEIRNRLFNKINPYSTRGTANEKGTGLGLILCKEFVEKNNGRIWVESQEGKGSTFSFTVPKAS